MLGCCAVAGQEAVPRPAVYLSVHCAHRLAVRTLRSKISPYVPGRGLAASCHPCWPSLLFLSLLFLVLSAALFCLVIAESKLPRTAGGRDHRSSAVSWVLLSFRSLCSAHDTGSLWISTLYCLPSSSFETHIIDKRTESQTKIICPKSHSL